MDITGLRQVSVPVTDMDRAVGFYRDTLGLRHIATFGSIAFVDVGGVRLILEAGGAEQGASVLYLAVADIAAARADLVAQGVEFVDEPHVIFHDEGGMFGEPGLSEWMTFFRDPDGNKIGRASCRERV